MIRCEFAIVGGGIAGTSAAYGLARAGVRDMVLLERESQLAYHTTGRSAAWYVPSYGNAAVRRLTVASGGFFRDPPPGFSDVPLIAPRPVLHIARSGRAVLAEALLRAKEPPIAALRRLNGEAVATACPALRMSEIAAAVAEADCGDLDVHALQQGFLREAKASGLTIFSDAEIVGMTRQAGEWHIATRAGPVAARVVVNAAGAWADGLAMLAGAVPQALEPRRRTIVLFQTSASLAPDAPLVIDLDENFYFKPDHGLVLASPADETLSPPCDAQPERIDIARTLQRVEQVADFPQAVVKRAWAGLRTFAPTRSPVFGYDAAAPDFFWAAGQGGFGIQTAPAAARLIAALALRQNVPGDLSREGVRAGDYIPKS